MNEIIKKEPLATNIFRYSLKNKDIAEAWKPGQFVIIRVHDMGERIPLTIAGVDKERGSLDIIFQAAGKTTHMLSDLDEGDSILDMAGPLGTPSEIEKYGRVLVIGGGVGTAVAYPVLGALKEAGNEVSAIIGARSEEYLILENEIKEKSDKVYVVTDDGSAGKKGFVTDILKELLDKADKFDLVYAVGPVLMMQKVTEITKEHNIKTIVSLNTIMIDGTGMCGGCRTVVGGEEKFACVHGPEFDAHKVNFELLAQRLKMFDKHECRALEAYKKKKNK